MLLDDPSEGRNEASGEGYQSHAARSEVPHFFRQGSTRIMEIIDGLEEKDVSAFQATLAEGRQAQFQDLPENEQMLMCAVSRLDGGEQESLREMLESMPYGVGVHDVANFIRRCVMFSVTVH